MALALAFAAVPIPQTAQAPEQVLRSATGRALQGDMAGAVTLLKQLHAPQLSEKDRATRACMLERFRPSEALEEGNAIGGAAGEMLRLYRSYWHKSLMQPEAVASQEETLAVGLRRLLGLPAKAGWEPIEADAKKRLISEGYSALMGRTPPLLEFVLWESQSSGIRQVALPEGRHPVRVFILDDFSSLGWSAYATCDRSFTGGWVKGDGIYAVRPGWKDLRAENFQVSFVAHETQHFADKQRFGDLQSWELEFRAKLAELALADQTLPRVLSAFISNQGSIRSVPHSFANRLVLSWLASELKVADHVDILKLPRDTVGKAAKDLLRRDSAVRKRLRNSPVRP